LLQYGSGLDDGETNRAQWRVVHEDNRLHLAPKSMAALLAGLDAHVPSEDWPLLLDTATESRHGRGWRARAPGAKEPGITAHPDCGVAEGTTVRVETRWGSVQGPLHHSERQHATTVWIPWGWAVPAGDVVGGPVDPESGSAQLVGEPCRLRPV
jgi:anaerobic selenocysteine-containing dehydrogenase